MLRPVGAPPQQPRGQLSWLPPQRVASPALQAAGQDAAHLHLCRELTILQRQPASEHDQQQQQHLGREAVLREVRLSLQTLSGNHSNAPQKAAELRQLLLRGILLRQISVTWIKPCSIRSGRPCSVGHEYVAAELLDSRSPQGRRALSPSAPPQNPQRKDGFGPTASFQAAIWGASVPRCSQRPAAALPSVTASCARSQPLGRYAVWPAHNTATSCSTSSSTRPLTPERQRAPRGTCCGMYMTPEAGMLHASTAGQGSAPPLAMSCS